jgi:hypothetical protein
MTTSRSVIAIPIDPSKLGGRENSRELKSADEGDLSLHDERELCRMRVRYVRVNVEGKG